MRRFWKTTHGEDSLAIFWPILLGVLVILSVIALSLG
jgi:hypothetical protein